MAKSGIEPPEAMAAGRVGQIFAEMLGMVCHREYFDDETKEGPQTVDDLLKGSYWQGIVVHVDGCSMAFYWARFDAEYLSRVGGDVMILAV